MQYRRRHYAVYCGPSCHPAISCFIKIPDGAAEPLQRAPYSKSLWWWWWWLMMLITFLAYLGCPGKIRPLNGSLSYKLTVKIMQTIQHFAGLNIFPRLS